MYPVSQDFLEKMRADLRRVDAKLVIDWTAPDLDQSIQVTANENASTSYTQQTADGVTHATRKWASCDGSTYPDGNWFPAPGPGDLSENQMGWWGRQLAGTDGAFSEPYPALTITHAIRPVRSLRVVGDSARGEWPVDFTVELFGPDGTLLRTETVVGNTGIEWSMHLNPPVLDVVKQVLTITRWSHPDRQAKIIEFFTSIQETYYNDDIVEIRLLEERETSTGSLPVGNISANEITIRLANEDRKFDIRNPSSQLSGLLKPNRRIQVWLGSEGEWVPLGTFWSLDWDAPDDQLEAVTTARDRLERLRQTMYQSGSVQQNVSLHALVEQVLRDAGLRPGEYWIDPALQSIVIPWAYLAPTSHREALRTIAEAGLAVVYADRDGVVRIESMSGTPAAPVAEITEDDYFPPLSTPSRQEKVANEIVVTTQPLQPASVPEEVYRSTEPISVPAGQTITVTVFYTKQPVIEAVAALDNPPPGVSIVGATYYAWGADVHIQNTGGSAANVTMVITGKPLTVQGSERVVARDQASITENGVLRYEFPANPLVQTLAQAQAIANALLASAKDPRRDIEVEWRGNPALELGDTVTVVGQDVQIIRQEITWSGAMSARLTGRKVT